MRHLRLTALARFVSMALVVLWCAQPLVLVLHAQVHTHSYCAEHNAFEEGRRAGKDGQALSQALASLQADEQAPSPVAHTGTHEACTVAAAASPVLAQPAAPGGLVLAAAPHLEPAWPGEAPRIPLRVLDVAPKASPPGV